MARGARAGWPVVGAKPDEAREAASAGVTSGRDGMQLGRPVSGTVTFASINPAARPPHKIAELDIAHVPEGRQVFPEMTVREM